MHDIFTFVNRILRGGRSGVETTRATIEPGRHCTSRVATRPVFAAQHGTTLSGRLADTIRHSQRRIEKQTSVARPYVRT